ncbi:hypothetical protein CTI12_AA496740 [Artemisia annua]|uniref:Uncharacterized protein n=1 Tax=Artemisia annua TaxID=35608 RepID=A0A2U1LF03_ARTAN|nr:hypothetical protein CTI12_AA496740 [Artemisia annua]
MQDFGACMQILKLIHAEDSQDHELDRISKKTIGTLGYGNPLRPIRDFQQEVRYLDDPLNGDAVSGTSMVDDLISSLELIPLLMIAFAVQVFELHRLLKVNRSEGEDFKDRSPQLIVENDAFFGKPAHVSLVEKIPLEYVLKSETNVPIIKDNRDKRKDGTREFSAENVIEKGSLSSVQYVYHP